MLISVAPPLAKALINQNPQVGFSLAMYQVCKGKYEDRALAKGGIYKLFAGLKTIFNHNAVPKDNKPKSHQQVETPGLATQFASAPTR